MATPLQQLQAELSAQNPATRDAFAALTTLFNQYGLGTLAPAIQNYLQQGYSSDTVSILLQEDPAYQARFAGNQIRQKNNLVVLTPAEYLAAEASYRQILQRAGMPSSFYDSTADFTNWIGNDVSPDEVTSRVNLAVSATTQADPYVQAALKQQGITQGAAAAYFLDSQRALPIIQEQMKAAQIGGAALQNNLAYNQSSALTYAQEGVTQQQAQQAYQNIAEVLPTAEKLATISGTAYNQGTAEQEFLGQSGQAAFYRQQLAAQEQARFAGTPGAGPKSTEQKLVGNA